MVVSSRKQALLDFVAPFRLGAGRQLNESARRTLDGLLDDLSVENPTPVLRNGFQHLGGLWQCVFTTSRFVLDLDKTPGLKLSGAWQSVTIDAHRNAGHYFNIAELARGKKVKSVCGEFALIRPSLIEPVRIDVQYHWFYFAFRMMSQYEGHRAVADELERNRLRGRRRVPFHRSGWQSVVYLDGQLRVLRGNHGGVFVLTRQ
jgi:hypothetical protein